MSFGASLSVHSANGPAKIFLQRFFRNLRGAGIWWGRHSCLPVEDFQMKKNVPSRRSLLTTVATGTAATFLIPRARAEEAPPAKINGNINQSICRWCYGKIPLEELATKAKAMGYKSIELLSPDEYKKI